MQGIIQRIAIALRNRARRKLCREYARNVLRNKRIIAQLGLLNSRAEIEATAERIADEWPESAALRPQVDIFNYATKSPIVMPRVVIEDDCGYDGLVGQWNKPVEVKA